MKTRRGGVRWGKPRRSTARALRLDVRQLVRGCRGGAWPRTGSWCSSGKLTWEGGAPVAVRLLFAFEGAEGAAPPAGLLVLWDPVQGTQSRGHPLRLEPTRPHFGGWRWWVRCPNCDCRAAVLWGPPFMCRSCHRLQYASAQASKRTRAAMAINRLAERFVGRRQLEVYDIPAKPLWMRWPTYRRLAAAAQRALERDAALAPARHRKQAASDVESAVRAVDTPSLARGRRRSFAAELQRRRKQPAA
jgi:hypothetical protein